MEGYTNRGTFAWGDPGASKRPLTEIVRSVLVNSAARDPKLPNGSLSSPGEYVYQFEAPQRNVSSVQLGSFVLGEDPRLPFDEAHVSFQVSEPILLATQTSVTVRVVESYYSLTANGDTVLDSVTTVTDQAIVAPPTHVTVSSATANGQLFLENEQNHYFGTFTVPESARDNLVLVRGANVRTRPSFRNEPLSVDLDNLNPTTPFPEDWAVDFSSDYENLANLDDSNGGLSGSWSRFRLVDPAFYLSQPASMGTRANAYVVSFPRLTLNELAEEIDNQLGELSSSGALPLRVHATLSSVTGEFALFASGGVTRYPTYQVERTVQIIGASEGDMFWHLGLDQSTLTLPGLISRTRDRRGFYESTQYGASTMYPNSARTIRVPNSSLTSAQQLVDILNRQTNPLYFSATLTDDERTLFFRSSSGSVSSITIMAGRYDPDLFVDSANYLLSTTVSSTTGVSAEFENGSVRFVSPDATPFTVDFERSPALAEILHFDKRPYSGTLTAPVEDDILTGYSVVQDTLTGLTRPIWWSTVSSSDPRLRANTQGITGASNDGVYIENATWTSTLQTSIRAEVFVLDGTTSISYAHSLRPGDVVTTYNPDNLTTSISFVPQPFYGLVTAGGTEEDPNSVEIYLGAAAWRMFSANGNLDGFQNFSLTADIGTGVYPLSADERQDFLLHGQRPPLQTVFPAGDYTGSRVSDNFSSAVGVGRSYGPIESMLGMQAQILVSSASAITLPSIYTLSPPTVVLVELVSPTARSHVQEYEASRDRPLSFLPTTAGTGLGGSGTSVLLAVLVITNGFARITEEMTHVDSLGPMNIKELHLRFLNPDLSVVDWRDKNHFLSILTRQSMGKAETQAVY